MQINYSELIHLQVKIHFMENNKPPVKIISPGRVYRNEDISVRSYCLFHQIEGLYVDKDVSFADLKGVMEFFSKKYFGEDVKLDLDQVIFLLQNQVLKWIYIGD